MKRFFTLLTLALLSTPQLVNAQCTADIIAPTVAISNCTGPQLSATLTGSGPFSYSWSASAPGSVSSTTSGTPNLNSTGAGLVVVTLITIDGGGCTAVDQDTVMFYTPTDTFDVYSCTYPDTICPLPLAMLGSPSWSYTDSSGTTSLTTLPGGCVAATQPGSYQMFGIYVSACTVNHTYLVYDTCVSVGPCSVDIGPDILGISNCNGPSLESTATGSGSISYAWSGSVNVTFNTPTAATTVVSAAGPGVEIIMLTITDSTGCVASDQMTMTFYYPTDTFYVSFPCLPDTICGLDIPMIGSPSWTYIDSTGSSTPAGNTPCIQATQQGTYQLFTIYETNCTVIHKYIVSDSCGTGIFEHASMVEAGLYPNPASDQVTIITDELLKNLIIWDATGREVMTKANYQKNNKFTFSIAYLLNGSYVVRIQTEKGFVNKHLVKINR